MRNKIIVSAISLVFGCAAFMPSYAGYNIGIQGGMSSLGYYTTDVVKSGSGSVKSNKAFGRIYGGYDFTENLGLQLGYAYYGKPEFTSSSGLKQSFTQQGVDLSGLVSLHFAHNFGFYLKGGTTWVFRSSVPDSTYFKAKASSSKLALLLGLGATYDFTKSLTADLSATRIFNNGNLPKMDLYGIGLTYRFGL
ncbi:MAG: outer membrane beta-barrel protein [Gammaproteobacteria bacterium]